MMGSKASKALTVSASYETFAAEGDGGKILTWIGAVTAKS
jgi:hypothetical protein